jgi:hypothetical protein
MATSVGTAHLGVQAQPDTAIWPEERVADQVRVLCGPTRWYATPLCAVISHRWSATSWSRWAIGWDREVTCKRCGQMRHERAKLHADLPDEDDR